MRVLVVSHEASLSGAPRVAQMVGDALRAAGHTVSVVSRRPGPLLSDFAETGPAGVEPAHRLRARLWRTRRAATAALVVDTAMALATLLRRRPELVYLNSTSSAVYLRPALWLRVPVVVHSHESAAVADRFLAPTRSRALLARARLAGCSPTSRSDLARLAGVPEDAVALVRSVPDVARVLLRARAGRPVHDRAGGELVVGCCGSVEHRKGADQFLELRRLVADRAPDLAVRFVWVGPVEPDFVGVADDVFVGALANPYPSMRDFDVFVLPSRDDPFPLVVTESMWLGVPVVGFAVGGVAEQVGDGGVVVAPGDTPALADALVQVLRDADVRRGLGERARARAARLWSTAAFAAGVLQLVGPPAQAQRVVPAPTAPASSGTARGAVQAAGER